MSPDGLDIQTFGDPGHPTLLFVGGADESLGGWERLADGARFVVRYRPSRDLVRDVVGVIDKFGLDHVHLVVRSSDAGIARRTMLAVPDHIASFVLLSTGSESVEPDTSVPTLVTGGDDAVPAILRHTSGGWDRQADRLAGKAIAAGDPTGWFERLYSAARRGEVAMPWDRAQPNRFLVSWTQGFEGAGRRALVVGCGLGVDAEYVAGLGFRTDAFDVAESAIRTARARYPDSPVRYRTADLLNPPAEWRGAFDLVVEFYTVQAMPVNVRARAIANVAAMVGPGGTLLACATARDEKDDSHNGPPWPLARTEIEAFAAGELTRVRIENYRDPGDPGWARWLAEFRRADGANHNRGSDNTD